VNKLVEKLEANRLCAING